MRVAITVIITLSTTAWAQPDPQPISRPPGDTPALEPSVPPIQASHLVAEYGLGLVGGVALGTAGALAGYWAECHGRSYCGEFGGIATGFVGLVAGGMGGISLGVFVAGHLDGETGSFGRTIGGAFLGATIAIPAGMLVYSLDAHTRYDSTQHSLVAPATALVVMSGFVGGAMYGFNSARRLRCPVMPAVVRDGETTLVVAGGTF